jgi:hypothetical protein
MKRAMSLLAFLTLTPALLVACQPAPDQSAGIDSAMDDPLTRPVDPDLTTPAPPLGAPLDQAQDPMAPAPELYIAEEGDPGYSADGLGDDLNDVTLQVMALQANGEQIELDLIVYNDSEEPVALNATESGLILVDDLGNTYALATPEENPELQIEPSSDWQQRLVFQGDLPEEAQFLTLITNFGPEPDLPQQPKLTLPGIPIRS